MNRRAVLIGGVLLALISFSGLMIFLASKGTVSVLQPAGVIAEQQRDLLIFATALSMFVVIPVFLLTIYIATKYRAGNTTAAYAPEFHSSKKLETIWWGLPILIIIVLSVITWRTSHALDPYKPIESDTAALTVQVVALDWKWMFIYPEQGIATINYLQIPEDTPINFRITADAAMNSFWIPQLGGMVYAMSGMETKLHLMASQQGTFRGASSNISGEGFADMKFNVTATSRSDFDAWVSASKKLPQALTHKTYAEVSKPTTAHPPTIYGAVSDDLYKSIIDSYMSHGYDHADHEGTKHELNDDHSDHGGEH